MSLRSWVRVVVATALALVPAASAVLSAEFARVRTAPVVIASDADFTAENGVYGGTGTEADPFLIDVGSIQAGSNASAANSAAMAVSATTRAFTVTGLRCSGFRLGLHLHDVQASVVRVQSAGVVVDATASTASPDAVGVLVDGGIGRVWLGGGMRIGSVSAATCGSSAGIAVVGTMTAATSVSLDGVSVSSVSLGSCLNATRPPGAAAGVLVQPAGPQAPPVGAFNATDVTVAAVTGGYACGVCVMGVSSTLTRVTATGVHGSAGNVTGISVAAPTSISDSSAHDVYAAAGGNYSIGITVLASAPYAASVSGVTAGSVRAAAGAKGASPQAGTGFVGGNATGVLVVGAGMVRMSGVHVAGVTSGTGGAGGDTYGGTLAGCGGSGGAGGAATGVDLGSCPHCDPASGSLTVDSVAAGAGGKGAPSPLLSGGAGGDGGDAVGVLYAAGGAQDPRAAIGSVDGGQGGLPGVGTSVSPPAAPGKPGKAYKTRVRAAWAPVVTALRGSAPRGLVGPV